MVTKEKTKKVSVTTNKDGLCFVAIEDLEPEKGFNVRRDTRPEPEFVGSVKRNGVRRPIDARWMDNKHSKLNIIDGERRWNAAKEAGLGSVPVLIHSDLSEREAVVLSLTAGEHQKRLSRREMDLGFRKLHHLGLEPEKIAETMGVELRLVNDALRVATAVKVVKEAAKKGVREGGIDRRVAGRVARLPKETQKEIAPELEGVPREEGLEKVRKVEKKIGIKRPGPKAEDAPKGPPPPYFAEDAAERCKLFEKELNNIVHLGSLTSSRIYVRQALMILQSLQGKISAIDVLSSLNPSGKYHG